MSDAESTSREHGLDRRTLLVTSGILLAAGALAPVVMGDGPDDDPPADLFAARYQDRLTTTSAEVEPIGGKDQVVVQSSAAIKPFADGATVAVVLAGNDGTADVEQLGDRGPVRATGVVDLVFGEARDLAAVRG